MQTTNDESDRMDDPTPISNDYRSITTTLTQTLQNLQIKAEVSATLESIIHDIELTHSINTTLRTEEEIETLKGEKRRAERALEEYVAMAKEKEERDRKLADRFVKELMGLSMYIEDFEEWKTIAQKEKIIRVKDTVDGNGENISNLEDTDLIVGEGKEEKMVTLNSSKEPKAAAAGAVVNSNLNETMENGLHQNGGMQQSSSTATIASLPTENDEPRENHLASSTTGPDAAAGEVIQTEEKVTDKETAEEAIIKPTNTTSQNIEEDTNSPPIPSSASQPSPIPTQPPTLQDFEGDLLMKIFEFTDALDILNLAQTSILIYSKVDTIFGLGGTVGLAGSDSKDEADPAVVLDPSPAVVVVDDVDVDEVEEEEVTEERKDIQDETPRASPTIASVPQPKSSQNQDMTVSATESASPKATIVQVPPPRTAKVSSNTTEAANVENSTIVPSSVSQQDEINPKPTPQPKTSSTEQLTAKSNESRGFSSSSTTGFQMSASVANSLATKLSPVELSAIIAMREELRKKDKQVIQLEEECEDLTSQLIGTVSVKETLTEKMKEMRIALDRGDNAAAKVARQTSSDQEVIAFLDERVQELEKSVDALQVEKTKAEEAVKKIKNGSEKQVRVMKDMLTFEREQLAGNEREWKSKKKVLVKEVKLCRAQIMALEAERDGFSQENAKLKEALLSLGNARHKR